MDDDLPHHEGLEARIATAITPALGQLGYELVRVQVSGKERPVVQIMADRADEAHFRVEDCEAISHAVGAVLDVEDPIRGEWTLEVSSAGIDRPLTRAKDWNRFAGHLAAVELALETGVPSKTHVLNVLHRLLDGKPPVAPVTAPQALRLANEPKANVLRYDSLRIKAQAAMTIRAAQEYYHAS